MGRRVIYPMAEVTGMERRPPFPPYTLETALEKVHAAEDAWNSRDPEMVAMAYTVNSHWRNRTEFVNGRAEIVGFLQRKWANELEYRLVKELWGNKENRMAVRFCYESRTADGQWFRSYGNELWEFEENGLMQARHASINDLPITESERKFRWEPGPRPKGHPGLSEMGL